MSEEKKFSSDSIEEIMKHFQARMRKDIKDGTLDHRSLEKHLGDAIQQFTAEARKEAGTLLNEANDEKKTSPARTAEKKQE